ncbi:MFS transporter [Periweissella beninensis]|uniref:MFS transporter n=1 Tax=Periweissella beninensis TaxID=504936 RepID=UPI0032DB329C
MIGFGDGIINTNLYAYAAMVTHHSQRKVFNLLAVTMNLGVVLGTIIVGLLYQRGVTYIFLMAALMYLGCLSLVSLHFSLPALAKVIAKKRLVFRPSKVVSAIAILVFTIYFGYVMWEAPIAVHMTNLGMSVQDYTNLWTINGLIIVFLQTVIGWLARKWSYQARVLIGSAIFAVSFLMLTTAKNYVLFICIMAILTLGEMLISPNVPIWVDNLVTENVRGQAQGFVNMMISLGRAVGPLIGGVIIEKYSYNVLFLCIFLLIMSVVLIIFMTNKVTRHNKAIDFDKS